MKNKKTAWETFAKSGKIEDYLKYKRLINAEAAKENGCRIALYGHTHRAEIAERDGITVINPGNLERYGVKNSFCYMVVTGEKVTAVINENLN